MVQFAAHDLGRFANRDVVVHLHDGSAFAGRLRTELLSERSLSVLLAKHGGEGVVLYIDQIDEIVFEPNSTS